METDGIRGGDGGTDAARHPDRPGGVARCAEAGPRYRERWADERARYPGEIALRDLATTREEEHALIFARFACSRWMHKMLLGTPPHELESERQAARAYAAAALDPGPPAELTHEGSAAAPAALPAAIATLLRLTEAAGPPDPETLLAGLRKASGHAAALGHASGVLDLDRLGYLVALASRSWLEARRFAGELARHLAGHGAHRAAGRWQRRGQALERRIRGSTTRRN